MPSYDEQKQIVQTLLIELNKIDALIAEQEKLISLLQEKRQAVISHAVTKGLNPDAPLKDSGVEWLGKVPVEWIVLPLKRMVKSISTGRTPNLEIGNYDTESILPWFTPGDFTDFVLTSSNRVFPLRLLLDSGIIFEGPAVLLVGIGATLGKISVAHGKFSANQQINIIIPDSNADFRFIAYALFSQLAQMCCMSNVSTIGILNQEKTGNLHIALPPLSDQKHIIEYLNSQTKKIDILIAESERTVALLMERRTALISAAVTGKIDVRGLVLKGNSA